MDEEYDVIVCGTGLKECILSGLLSVSGKKVLHLDKNPYYGGESASLNLSNLYEHFYPGSTPPPHFGPNRDWNVDLIPKFVMSTGKLVKMLLKTNVKQYLKWHIIEGTYVYQQNKSSFWGSSSPIHKVPSTVTEVMTSSLMGLWEKRRCKNFFQYCIDWKIDDHKTWKGFNPYKTTTKELFDHFNLHQDTIDFIGHAVALYTNDNYLKEPIFKCLDKICLYMSSISNYGKSPFIYPMYGLGGLPEGFSRQSAIHGGTYMLNKPVECFLYDKNGKVCGVKSVDGEIAYCKAVVCDPSYVINKDDQKKVKIVGQTVRCICILGQPVPNTNSASSCQIILPQKQLNRHNDVYVTIVSSHNGVATNGKYIAIVSTQVETDDPTAEIQPAIELLGKIEAHFFSISDTWESTQNGNEDHVYVSHSFDATSHFESASDDVLRMWKEITGTDYDLTLSQEYEDAD